MFEQGIVLMGVAIRYLFAAALICGSTIICFAEEPYLETGKLLGACLGTELKKTGGSHVPAEVMDQYLLLRCGYLEEREEKEFMDFISSRLARPLNPKEQAELSLIIISELLIEHTRGGLRRTVVDVYKKTIIDRK